MKEILKSPHVLVVNDQRVVLTLLSSLLEREGYQVAATDNAAHGLQLALQGEPDIIISDVVMPEMDGLEFCRLLKSTAQTRNVPVLLISALLTEEADSLRGLLAGADDYLEIPFQRQELSIKVARLTERHRVEKHYRGIVEHAADIIYTCDIGGGITSINEAGARFFGLPISELNGRPLGQFLKAEAIVKDCPETTDPGSCQPQRRLYRLTDAEGQQRYLEEIVTVMKDAQGRSIGERGVVRDITRRKLTEEALRESEERYSALFRKSSDAITLFDPQTVRIVEANPSLTALLGYDAAEILNLTLYDIVAAPPESIDLKIKEVLEKGTCMVGARQYRRKDGSLVDVEVTANLISYRGRDLVFGCARDITERRTAEEALRESEKRYRDLIENANDVIYTHDLQGNLTSLNKAGEKTTGYSREEAVKMNLAQLVAPEYLELARNMLSEKAGGETAAVHELEIIAKDKRRVTLEVSTRFIYHAGKPVGVQGIARDVTEQKQQRQRAAQADKLRALGQLASGVAHDFNNSLTAILGRTRLARRQQVESEVIRRDLDIIQTAAEDAAMTVRRIQTFARQQQIQEFEALDVSVLLRDSIEITRTRWENEARSRGLDFEIDLVTDPNLFTQGNASELREIFVNLILNAVDAMPLGGRISIECQRNGDRLSLAFRDTGTGMTQEVLEKAFEPFYTTKGAQGTGLGLALSYGIVKGHGGSIRVESEAGRGTTFLIELPATEPGSASQLRTHEEQAHSLDILVIDDEMVVRETLRDMLTALGHRVADAASGPEALRISGLKDFDLVFTDLSMPEMDGWKLAREIRRLSPDLNIVLFTGHGTDVLPPPGESNPVDCVIGKPFDFDQINKTIVGLIRQSREMTATG
jgi:PAS domain S-box-containing protein